MLFLLTTAFATPMLSADDPSGSLRARLAEDDADVVLVYGSEQEGELGPCGCDAVERGGMERIRGYRTAVARGDAPVFLLHAGGFLDPRPMQDDRNDAMIGEVGDWDALHVGFRDAPGLGRYLDGAAWAEAWKPSLPDGLVSASITGPWSAWRLVEREGVTVAVTGVSAAKSTERFPSGLSAADPVDALTSALADAPEADLHVVLAYDTADLTDDLAALPGVDVLIEAGGYTARWEADASHGAVWVRSTKGSTRLGELRVWLEDGRVIKAVDRQIPVDRSLPKRRR
ncbi:MAG: hypothetical protein EP330_06260 [Deltaproteobacteria bacterium]|nr:MAG: hypothetical protein EP330_06260 [Deltaproteobacteria bacterium]